MALRPCSVCNRMFRGAALHMYPTLVTANESYTAHLRVCQGDFDLLTTQWADNEMNAQEGLFDDGPRPNCPACQESVEPGQLAQFFATTYAGSDVRSDWWAPVHDGCWQAIRTVFGMLLRG